MWNVDVITAGSRLLEPRNAIARLCVCVCVCECVHWFPLRVHVT